MLVHAMNEDNASKLMGDYSVNTPCFILWGIDDQGRGCCLFATATSVRLGDIEFFKFCNVQFTCLVDI